MSDLSIEDRIGEYWAQDPKTRIFTFKLNEYAGLRQQDLADVCRMVEANHASKIEVLRSLGVVSVDGTIEDVTTETKFSDIKDILFVHELMKFLSAE